MPPTEPKSDTIQYVVGIIIVGLFIAGISFVGSTRETSDKSSVQETETTASGKESMATPALEMPQKTVPAVAKEQIKPVDIIYTDENGFTPDYISVKLGTTVRFLNQSSGDMWVGADDHPSHTQYSGTTLREHCPDTTGTNFDQCGTGKEYSFTFKKAGTWGYHDHKSPRMRGIIIVK